MVSAVGELQREEDDNENLVSELKRNLMYMKELDVTVKEKRRLDDLEEKERDEFMYQLQVCHHHHFLFFFLLFKFFWFQKILLEWKKFI